MARQIQNKKVAESLAQAMKGHKKQKGGSSDKIGRNRVKCAQYRSRVGKPRGRGVAGNKRGKNKN